jgi:uncharacterized protein YecE (DUF72 family)
MQVSDKFSPAKKQNLFSYLERLPKDITFFAEVRHPAWFAEPATREELFQQLRNSKIGAVLTDTAGRRDCVHMELPIPKAFIRFVGNDLHPSDYARIDGWVKRIKSWLDQGLHELYFFMHQTDETFSPDLSDYVAEQLNKHCNAELIRPSFISPQS